MYSECLTSQWSSLLQKGNMSIASILALQMIHMILRWFSSFQQVRQWNNHSHNITSKKKCPSACVFWSNWTCKAYFRRTTCPCISGWIDGEIWRKHWVFIRLYLGTSHRVWTSPSFLRGMGQHAVADRSRLPDIWAIYGNLGWFVVAICCYQWCGCPTFGFIFTFIKPQTELCPASRAPAFNSEGWLLGQVPVQRGFTMESIGLKKTYFSRPPPPRNCGAFMNFHDSWELSGRGHVIF